MTTYIGVLRAINLGSHNKIAMSDLRAMLEKVGCEEPKTRGAERQCRLQELDRIG